ncbi:MULTISPECIES: MrcB family domain-containing protein [Glaesserella]|uniref:DUF3578 domain-containing protein n=1 Tax=Glaesserella australis TaxID=2094024 RepID=A0A328C0T6_9PAST|nr:MULTISPECIES: DUF3578 domain-containing protein [Glaesserella]AUI66325.1 restriction endonuclease [Glaesserella sp. 15-184]RAL19461.1 DUF3578 domain-containing protein [Glaesserella australis]
MQNLGNYLYQVLSELGSAKQQPFKDHKLANFLRDEFPKEISGILKANNLSSYSIKGHPGNGGWADILWIEIINPSITQSVQSDIYPTYLFKSDGSGVYLSLQQGADKLSNEQFSKFATFKSTLLSNIPELQGWNTNFIDLLASTTRSKNYEKTNLAAKFYDREHIPSDEELISDLFAMLKLYEKVAKQIKSEQQKSEVIAENDVKQNLLSIPKPFLLLAGISGTGKSRFVREQVVESERSERYQLVAVRPDWHEPSDLLGYVSRLSGTAQYVMTDVLKFIVKAWQAVEKAQLIENNTVKGSKEKLAEVAPYWLCLDEMNLAPVEQYFADYLSIIESRKWEWVSPNHFIYKTEALLSATAWDTIVGFKEQLGVSEKLWNFFQQNGIGIPFNLIVAGTVNMDETTHAFSRKVLDRALSFDFSEFYPNDFEYFFAPKTQQKQLTYPIYSQLTQENLTEEELVFAKKSTQFLTALNKKLENTPFKLGYRALNELLLGLKSYQPKNDDELEAVWDDFVMMKVLPRIEGDENKLGTVLDDVGNVLETNLTHIWNDELTRLDFWQTDNDGNEYKVKCRTKPKLAHMKMQLIKRGMVSFW